MVKYFFLGLREAYQEPYCGRRVYTAMGTAFSSFLKNTTHLWVMENAVNVLMVTFKI